MKMMQSRCEPVYVTSCDVPLLQPAFVRHLLSLAEGFDAVVPQDGEFCHPLSAVYRTNLPGRIEEQLAVDQLRPTTLVQCVATRFVSVDELRVSDPELQTLRNLNHPADYAAALRSAGFEISPDIAAALGLEPKSS